MANTGTKDRPVVVARSMRQRMALGLTACAVSVVVMAFTLASVLQGEAALRWWPWMASAQAGAASDILEGHGADPSAIADSKAHAIAALRLNPINVIAVRTLGLATALQNQDAAASRDFGYALRLSRRDVPTQMWFIERAVDRNDIAGALHHYNQAMTTSIASRQMLVPILVQAAAIPAVAEQLIPLLRRKPDWWGDFTHQLIGTTSDPASLYRVARGLRLHSSDTEHPDFLPRIVQRLVTAGELGKALDLYRFDKATPSSIVNNGHFEQADTMPPIDWQYADEPDLAGVRQGRPDGKGTALFLVAQAGRGGTVAEQLVWLSPGRYRLSMTIGDMPAGNAGSLAQLTLRCEGADKRPITTISLPAAPAGGRSFTTEFLVPPASCPVQRLGIVAAGSLTGTGDAAPWIDDIVITPSHDR